MTANKYIVDRKAKTAFRDLLSTYQGIIDFEEAFGDFFDPTDTGLYDGYKSQIANSSDQKITNQQSARALTGPFDGLTTASSPGTYFHAQFTSFKSIGLITGVNVGYVAQLRPGREIYSLENSKESNRAHLQHSFWSQKAFEDKIPNHPAHAFIPNSTEELIITFPGVQATQTIPESEEVFFLSPSIIKYLLRSGAAWSVDNNNRPSLHWELGTQLYKLLTVLSLNRTYYKKWHKKPANREPPISPGGYRHPQKKLNELVNTFGSLDPKTHLSDLMEPMNSGRYSEVLEDDYVIYPNAVPTRVSLPGILPDDKTQIYLGEGTGAQDNVEVGIRGTTEYFALNGTSKQGFYRKWKQSAAARAEAGGIINEIDATIRKMLGNLRSSVKKGTRFAEDRLLVRKNARLTDIVAFFGQTNPETVTAQAAVADITAPEAKNLLESIPLPKRNLKPIDLQCFLLEQVRAIAGQHQPDYKNIIRLNSEGNPGIVKNKITSPLGKNQAKALLSICPDVQALLVPYLKISRVTYDDDGEATGKELDLDIPNFVKKDEINDILGKGRLPGAGIKSFSWSLDGVQPAEVDNNISATLELYFQTVSDFFNNASQAGEERRASYLDLVISSASTNSDDKNESSAKCNAELARRYDGENYRIKVVAGWATPDENTLAALGSMSRQKYKNLLAAIEKSKIILFLQQIRHDFKFNQDGSLNLTVEYQASLSGMATSPRADILGPSQGESQKRIEYTEKHAEKLKTKYGTEAEPEEKVKIKEALEEVKKARNEDRMRKYKRLLSRLFKSGKIYSLSVSPEELLLPPYSDLTPEERAKRAKRRGASTPEVWQSPADGNIAILDAIAAGETRTPDDDSNELNEFVSNKFSVDLQKEYDDLPGSTDKIWVSFFYLGDLIDMVLEQIKTNHDRSSIPFKFFISDVEMIDPLSALKIKNLDELLKCKQNLKNATFLAALVETNPTEFTEANGISELMNIGDIPIGLDAFQVWFKNHVIKKNRDKYFFLHFIKDICGDLVTKALDSKCFGPDVSFTQRFDAQPISFKRNENLQPNAIIRAGGTESGYSLAKSVRQLTSTTSPTNSDLGLVLLSTDSKPYGLEGEKSYDNDLDKGVYHHYLGSACGLVKTINFNREDQPFLRETKIQKVGSLGAEQLRELYSAEMELYGNTLYKNGNYVYINPKLFGATDRQLTLLGLHGYYLITKVSSTVTESSFNVSIRALHEGIEFSGDQLMLPESYDNLVADEAPLSDSTNSFGPAGAAGNPVMERIREMRAAGNPDVFVVEATELSRLGLISEKRRDYEIRKYYAEKEYAAGETNEAQFAMFFKDDPYLTDRSNDLSPLPSLQ